MKPPRDDEDRGGASSSPMPSEGARLIADSMLGRLAKALRMLGFDVAYDPFIEDPELIRRAVAEGRVLLTRDTGLMRCRDLPPHVFVHSNHVPEQLAQVAQQAGLKLDARRALTRCTVCNDPLETVARESVRDAVPPYVYQTQREFARCPGCGRIYWRGTHVEHMQRVIERLLSGRA